ncbi:helix-turn-helix transcriptional regulator [Paenibacillus sp. FSL R7-0204]|uniref:helix-turn-helix domain-containing protein n=1 Tax=Paenibacillus sp. FSL R7-0204 TaxID=2921675 RepID=UPI0030FCFC03
MISQTSLEGYKGASLIRDKHFLYVSPHLLLRPFISSYTISTPTVQTMSNEYAVLPSASSTLVLSVTHHNIISSLRGTNTKVCHVGAFANKLKLLFLIEFHPGGLHPFIKADQSELLDASFMLDQLDKTLKQALEDILLESESIDSLLNTVNRIFIHRLYARPISKDVSAIMNSIISKHGNVSAKRLSSEFYYSEKHIRRLFLRHIGTSPKMFSRIVRVNYALKLLQNKPEPFTEVAVQAGFFDQPHFNKDFKLLCGLTPQDYLKNMSVFYNDSFKM